MDGGAFQVEKVFPYLVRIEIPYFSLGGRTAVVNIFLIIDRELVLIDTGPWREDYAKELSSCLFRLGFSIKDISKIIYTHAHPDHMGAAVQLTSETEILQSVYWKAEKHVAQYGEYIAFMKSLFKNTFHEYLRQNSQRGEWYRAVIDNFWYPTFGEARIDHGLHDSEIIETEKLRFQVIFNPGHSPWDLSLWEEEKGLLFSGDALMEKMTTLTGGLNGFGSDLNEYESSLKKLGKYVEKSGYVFPSHGLPMTDGLRSIGDIAKGIRWREDKILERLSLDKCRLLDLEDTFSPNDDPVVFVRRVGVLLTHLERLEKRGSVLRCQEDNGEIFFMLKQ
ncbi:metallo-beta-lactamase domain protein [delta proteobacterium NaphS2]|nr:metallo-beta-lactamase domain protein [delta proteobacterium NaphS2]